MRIVFKISESYPELLEDLARLAPNSRAERIRVLATLGLLALRESSVISPFQNAERKEYGSDLAVSNNTSIDSDESSNIDLTSSPKTSILEPDHNPPAHAGDGRPLVDGSIIPSNSPSPSSRGVVGGQEEALSEVERRRRRLISRSLG